MIKKNLKLQVIFLSALAAVNAASAATLTVKVLNNGTPLPMAGVQVAVISFDPATGEPSSSTTRTMIDVTNNAGQSAFTLENGRDYFIAVTTPGFMPTVRDEMNDPSGQFFVNANANVSKVYQLFPFPSAGMANTLSVTVGAVPVDDLILGEVFFTQTRETVAYAMARSIDVSATVLRIFNIPSAPAGALGYRVSVAGKGKSMDGILQYQFPSVSSVTVDMTNAMPPPSFETTVSSIPPSVQGVVTDNTGLGIKDARVELSSNVWTSSCNCWQPSYRNEILTDSNGRFVFYYIPPVANGYDLAVRKLGYRFGFNHINTVPDYAPKIFQLDSATYTLTGVLKYNNVTVPWGDISVWGDWSSWNGTDIYAVKSRTQGNAGMQSDARIKVDGSGNFTISGLPDGNVRLAAAFQGGWYEFNNGVDGSYGGGDDRRITISSMAGAGYASGDVVLFDSAGAKVSTGPVIFSITPPAANALGKIEGTITFVSTYTISDTSPLAVSVSTPITIMATEEWHGGNQKQQAGFKAVTGELTSSVTSYSMTVSSGVNYYVQVLSKEWGLLTGFDTRADLRSTGTVTMNFVLTRSGSLKGTVKKPDGKNYRPQWPQNGNMDDPNAHWIEVNIRGVNTDVDFGTGLDESGSFEFPNIAPGIYNVKLMPRGQAFVWAPAVKDGVAVTIGKPTEITITLDESLSVQPQIFGLPSVSTPSWGYSVIAVPSGQQMNQKLITELFFSEPLYSFDYSTTTLSWSKKSMKPGQYDFYMVLGSNYNPEKGDSNKKVSYYQFANFMGQLKNVSIQKSESNPDLGTSAQPIPISILGTVGQSQIKGTMVGTKLFTNGDYERIFANFNELFPLIPAVMLYDASGDLRGFSNALPDETGIITFLAALNNKDKNGIIASIAANPLRYLVFGMPPGKYTAVFANPNYPPIAKEIELPSDETYNFDFDAQKVVAGVINGVVKSTVTGSGLDNALVSIKHRTVEKMLKTNASGAFSAINLPPGIYRIEASKDGFVTAGRKISLAGNATADMTFNLVSSTYSIAGKVYTRKFPSPMTAEGVKIAAYDETQNVTYPDMYLPKYETRTDPAGAYEIPAVAPGHKYKVAAFYPGKNAETILVEAASGRTQAQEIVLKDAPPEIIVKVRKSFEFTGKVDLIIKSPKELRSTPVCAYNSGSSYDPASAVSLTLVPGPDNVFIGRFTPSPNKPLYAIKVEAGEDQNKLEKTVVYDQSSDARTEQSVNEASIKGGQVYMDQEREEYSGIELDAGSLTSVSTATTDFSNLIGGFFSTLPSVRMVKTSRGTSQSVESAIKSLMASEVYNLDLSNAQQNKSLTLTLKYDKEKVTNTSALKVYQYNSATGSWQEVPGNYTIDPMSGVVSVDVSSLQEAYKGGSSSSPLKVKRYGAASVSPEGTYVPNADQPSSQTGQFAVFSAKPPTGVSYSGTAYEIYNLPNPFNLKTKTVNLSSDRGTAFSGSTYDVRGTLIKYHLPSDVTGSVKLIIYNVAGERVREIDDGNRAGGQVYYSEWDGKNDDGQDCASGVYFLLTRVDGRKIGSSAHKMALIK